jgi:hypothetical protein
MFKKAKFFSYLLFFGLMSMVGIAFSQETPPLAAEQGALPEVIIKGGEKAGVRSEKPPLDIKMDMDEPLQVLLGLEEDLLERQSESLQNPSAGFASYLYNQNVVLPARSRLAKDPVKIFYPLRSILALAPSQFEQIGTGWQMTITDSEGHPFIHFSGKGLPSAHLPWNGRNERGDMIGVGKNYSTVIKYRDTQGQTRTYVGNPFSFDGIVHQEREGLLISLANSALFEPKKGAFGEEEIGESGQELLKEAADWIKRFYFTFPIRINVYAKTTTLANTRAAAIVTTLNVLLILPRREIPYSGFASGFAEERIEIIISNR